MRDTATDTLQISICGFGGQGILLIGQFLGEAAVRDGLWAAGSSSYGAQARGAGCRSDLVVSRAPADYPHVLAADLFVAMSQGAYDQFVAEAGSEALVLVDHPHVTPRAEDGRAQVPVPATAEAVERFGGRQAANVVMLGALVVLSGVASERSVCEVVGEGLAPRFQEANRAALEAGFGLGRKVLLSFAEGIDPWRARTALGP